VHCEADAPLNTGTGTLVVTPFGVFVVINTVPALVVASNPTDTAIAVASEVLTTGVPASTFTDKPSVAETETSVPAGMGFSRLRLLSARRSVIEPAAE
jgi:hypothetical protein